MVPHNGDEASLPKWTSEMTSISPVRESVAGMAQHEDGTTPATSGDDEGERIANPSKNSRYLREMDRREILSRIEQGEKQATLAKEYQVSRAAICNLNKHREEVMSRKDENPLAKHPKKPRAKSTKIKIRASKAIKKLPSPRSGSGKANTHEVKSRAAALLLTSLRNKNTTINEFQRCSERLMRLIIEEALSLVPIKAVEVYLGDSVKADGVGWEHPPCVVSMEQACSPMLDLFRAIEPEQPTALARIDHSLGGDHSTASTTTTATLVDTTHLPASLKYHNVFVFDLSATSSEAICAVIQQLQERGAVEAMISVVVLFIASETIMQVRSKYPSVKFVAAQMDPSGKPTAAELASGSMASSEHSSSSASCCLGFVLDRFDQVYSSLPSNPATW